MHIPLKILFIKNYKQLELLIEKLKKTLSERVNELVKTSIEQNKSLIALRNENVVLKNGQLHQAIFFF